MSRIFTGIVLVLVTCAGAQTCLAVVWTQPTEVQEAFYSRGDHSIILPGGGNVTFLGTGPTVVKRDSRFAAFDPGTGRDTINTEIVLMHLVGKVDFAGTMYYAELFAGKDQGAYAGLDHTRGQVQDTAASPFDASPHGTTPLDPGVIDFHAESIFDVFFDVWIDFDDNRNKGLGEVLSNDTAHPNDYALRMENDWLEDFPPPVNSKYAAFTKVWESDPFIGTYWTPGENLPLDLYFIDPDRNRLASAGQVVPGVTTHTIICPEPITATLGLMGLGVLSMATRRRRVA